MDLRGHECLFHLKVWEKKFCLKLWKWIVWIQSIVIVSCIDILNFPQRWPFWKEMYAYRSNLFASKIFGAGRWKRLPTAFSDITYSLHYLFYFLFFSPSSTYHKLSHPSIISLLPSNVGVWIYTFAFEKSNYSRI